MKVKKDKSFFQSIRCIKRFCKKKLQKDRYFLVRTMHHCFCVKCSSSIKFLLHIKKCIKNILKNSFLFLNTFFLI